jgi:YfiH family protein
MKLAVRIHDGRVVTMRQVHGDNLVEVKDTAVKESGEADAMVTAASDVFLGVLTADCVPILLIAPEARIAGVVHAGWRGTVAGITAKAVRYFEDVFNVRPQALQAALGPAIGICCYEVGADVAGPLAERWGELARQCTSAGEGKPHVDLRRLNRGILQTAGVDAARISEIGPCTKCAASDFFSYRREGRETGRQMSVVGWASHG